MRYLAALVLLAVSARCQVLLYSSDMAGQYVPYDADTDADCPLDPVTSHKTSLFRRVLELEPETEEEDVQQDTLSSRWGDCGVGGVPRLAGELADLAEGIAVDVVMVSGGNILGGSGGNVTVGHVGAGNWELPANFSAALLAAAQFDVMGLGPGEFLRGASFLEEFLAAVNESARQTTVVACNVKSSLLDGLLVPSVNKSGIWFVGAVDPDVVEDYVRFDADMELLNTSCVQEEINKRPDPAMPVIVVGSAASLDSAIFKVNNAKAFVISGLPESEKEKALANQASYLVTAGKGSTVGLFNFSDTSAKHITQLDKTALEDSATANATAALQQMVTDFYTTGVESYFTLTSDRCDGTECSVGDVICDAALIGALLDGRGTTRPIAVWPGQNITGTIPKGRLAVSQLYNVLPSEPVALAHAKGSTVIRLFARAVQQMTVDASHSETFLQVSGVRVTYDLDLDPPYRAKYLMNLCLTCSPQEYLPVSESYNYTIVLPVSMVGHPFWSDITQEFMQVLVTGFSARDAVSAKAQVTGRMLAPVGDRIDFTHIPPNIEPTSDTFVAVLSTIIVCMVVFGLGVFGFTVWSRRQNQFGSNTALLR